MDGSGIAFEHLHSLQQFSDFYDARSVDDLMLVEFGRLHTSGPIDRLMFQYLAHHRRLTDVACFDADLSDMNRSKVIRTATWAREQIELNIFPSVEPTMKARAVEALASADAYLDQWSHYPQAALMLKVGARHPCGPYELGMMGHVLAKA